MLAQTKTADEVYTVALDRGRKMRTLGITVDFAPVVDVSDAPADTVIGDRSFGSDPAVVTAYAGAYARGLRDAGLLPVLKHFPGHGHGSGDSHTGAVTTPPLSELQRDDLVPYRTLVTANPVGVMIGHMQVPGLTGDQPASLSRPRCSCCVLVPATAVRPSTARSSATICPAWPRSPTVSAWPRRCCAPCKRAPTPRCGSRPTRFPRCWTGWKKRWPQGS
ncbi:glycosyl hydrolase family 3 N terminal domain protein [Mycobacterium xenopi 3993]|nr:glycosyl hydrolase family 3 N terminal domain protein [Mycobacterium xenopi 3993]